MTGCHFSVICLKQIRTRTRTNQLLFSFARIGVRLWNSIPKELRIKNRTPFKRELKNRLLKLLENEEMNVDIRCSEICKYLLIK